MNQVAMQQNAGLGHNSGDSREAWLKLFGPPKVPFPDPSILNDLWLKGRDWYELCDLYATNPRQMPSTSDLVRIVMRCNADGLNWRAQPFYFAGAQGINPTIGYWRMKAHRTGTYHGCNIEHEGHSEDGKGGEAWAQATVLKVVAGMRTVFKGPKITMREAMSTFTSKDGQTSPMGLWRSKPNIMLQKCAEAAALRLAYSHQEPDFETMKNVASVTSDALGMNEFEKGGDFQGPDMDFDETDAAPQVDGTELPPEERPKQITELVDQVHGGDPAPAAQVAANANPEPPATAALPDNF